MGKRYYATTLVVFSTYFRKKIGLECQILRKEFAQSEAGFQRLQTHYRHCNTSLKLRLLKDMIRMIGDLLNSKDHYSTFGLSKSILI